MPLSIAFFIVGGAQAIIYVVVRRFAQRAVVGKPPPLLRFVVALTGLVAVMLVSAGVYVALFID